jgi:uncharacterized protein (DUF2336 family)
VDVQQSLIEQLEGVAASQDLSKRAEVLHRVTDLFIHGSGKFSPEQIDLFDGVMMRLMEDIELAARIAFGSRLARVSDAPGKVIRKLAFDPASEVAAPVLTHSIRLDEATLVENAQTQSQGHLLAIAFRESVPEALTDVLVERGNDEVIAGTAGNRGAKFSTSGASNLVMRVQNNGDLALCVWSRPDIPRQDLVRLFAQASDAVRAKLERADPRRAALIRAAVTEASERIQAAARAGSQTHAQAFAEARALHSAGKLDEARLLRFVHEGVFDKTAVALSLMCEVPIGLVERALIQSEPEQLLVLAKAIDLSWETTKAILHQCAPRSGVTPEWFDQRYASFLRLQSKTAKTALQFYRLRERANRGCT